MDHISSYDKCCPVTLEARRKSFVAGIMGTADDQGTGWLVFLCFGVCCVLDVSAMQVEASPIVLYSLWKKGNAIRIRGL